MNNNMVCKNCGSPLPANAKFCGRCGAPVEWEDTPDKDENEIRVNSESTTDQKTTETDLSDEILDATTGEETGSKKPRNWRWIIIAGVVAIGVIILLVAFFTLHNRDDEDIASQEVQVIEVEEEKEEPVEEEIIDPEEELIETVKELSPEQIQQAAKDLYNELVECSVSDPQEFAELYLNATEDDIQSDLEYFSNCELDQDEKQIATIIMENAPSIAIQVDSYETEDEFLDIADDFIMTYTESGWKKDLSEDVYDQVYSSENMEEIYPEAFIQALDADRNVYQFDSCFLYLDDTAVYEGDFISKLAFLSQDEYDCLTAYIWMGNGTEEDVSVNEISLTVTDAALGTVLDQTVSHEETLEAGHSKLVQLHFDESSEVLTGSEKWTEMEVSILSESKDENASQTEQESGQNASDANQGVSNSNVDITMEMPDLYAETEYDIDAYCAALREQYQDLNLSTTTLFEDANLVFIGISYYDNGNERRGCISLQKTSAGSDKTIEDYKCSKCSGSGIVIEQGTETQTCPICAGTGQQYIPNAYYDAIMGWTGQYMVCSGCGGSGQIVYTTEYYTWCDKCNGYAVAK